MASNKTFNLTQAMIVGIPALILVCLGGVILGYALSSIIPIDPYIAGITQTGNMQTQYSRCDQELLNRVLETKITHPTGGMDKIRDLGPLIFCVVNGTAETVSDLEWTWNITDRGENGCAIELWTNYHGFDTLGPTFYINLGDEVIIPEGPDVSRIWSYYVDTYKLPLGP